LVNINPTLAYQVNDKVSVGAGIAYGYVQATLEARTYLSVLNTSLSGVSTTSPDGFKKLEGEGDGWRYSGASRQSTVNGTYGTTVYFLSANTTYRFGRRG